MSRRRLVLALVLVLALAPTVAWGQSAACPGLNSRLNSLNHQTLTISTTAVGLTVPAGTTMAVLSIQNQPVRFWDDGTAPTATVGVFLNATATAPAVLTVCPFQLSRIQFIRDTTATGDATASIHYYTGGF